MSIVHQHYYYPVIQLHVGVVMKSSIRLHRVIYVIYPVYSTVVHSRMYKVYGIERQVYSVLGEA